MTIWFSKSYFLSDIAVLLNINVRKMSRNAMTVKILYKHVQCILYILQKKTIQHYYLCTKFIEYRFKDSVIILITLKVCVYNTTKTNIMGKVCLLYTIYYIRSL